MSKESAALQADDQDGLAYTVLSRKTIMWAALLIMAVGIGMAIWLLTAFGHGNPVDQSRLDAIRTAGTIVVGTGGAAALLLAARRQRSTELALKHQEHVASAAEHDAIERRITELYARAGDQLDSDKAPVRLAGLYALERLAQGNEDYRQMVVDVLCAYLRMPYEPPTKLALSDDAHEEEVEPSDSEVPAQAQGPSSFNRERERERVQERQVRRAAQRILTSHLHPYVTRDGNSVEDKKFWPDIDIDLSGAVLIDLDMFGCKIRSAQFDNARFMGDTWFTDTAFDEAAFFVQATFSGGVSFDGIMAASGAHFGKSRFLGHASFSDAKFAGTTHFGMAKFYGHAHFTLVEFSGTTEFSLVEFADHGEFIEATFDGDAEFDRARFDGDALFDGAKFAGKVSFVNVEFEGHAQFDEDGFSAGVPDELSYLFRDE